MGPTWLHMTMTMTLITLLVKSLYTKRRPALMARVRGTCPSLADERNLLYAQEIDQSTPLRSLAA